MAGWFSRRSGSRGSIQNPVRRVLRAPSLSRNPMPPRTTRKSDRRKASDSHNGMTGSDSQAWVMLRIGRQAVQSHKRKEPVDEENKVGGIGCQSRDGFGARGGAGRGD